MAVASLAPARSDSVKGAAMRGDRGVSGDGDGDRDAYGDGYGHSLRNADIS